MTARTSVSATAELAHRVEAFEAALAADPAADLACFLPEHGHPLYFALLGELIRIDLEAAWNGGTPKRLSWYASRFPAVLEQRGLLNAVAFEEFRQRRRAGEDVTRADYRVTYGIDTTGWPSIPEQSDDAADTNDELPRTAQIQTPPPANAIASPRRSNAESLASLHEATASLPAAGTVFLGFHLKEELGRGAFGRVYLAEQGDLADRPVALKVACDIVRESRTLAQLQHPNIVPIYSFHRVGPFQAVCMPYLGRTTLADVLQDIRGMGRLPSSGREIHSTVNNRHGGTSPGSATGSGFASSRKTWRTRPLPNYPDIGTSETPTDPTQTPDGWARLDGLPYVDAVLTLAAGLTDGLAHAHRRGILHRDLKPANILLTDEGRPMLLDFNLAEDVKLRDSADRAAIGGTLPYMAPEHIHAFKSASGRLDERCDLYSLGVILYELLTRRHPFPVHKGPARETVPLMLSDRQQSPPRLRPYTPDVSPGVEAIVRKLLEPQPAARYQRAEELRDDLERHLAHRSLKHAANPSLVERGRKWVRRHPRLTSSAGVGVIAAVLLIAVESGAVYAREPAKFANRATNASQRVAIGVQIAFSTSRALGRRLRVG